MIARYFHYEEELHVDGRIFKATCRVRNEINGKRRHDQVFNTFPKNPDNERLPYMPRGFPTGIWEIRDPIWTDDIEYWPVKIPTSAVRKVMTWKVGDSGYLEPSGVVQEDAYYHLHFARNSITTLGCIRLDSDQDARELAWYIEKLKKDHQETWLEVFANKE